LFVSRTKIAVISLFILVPVFCRCSAQSLPKFDENRAYEYLVKQCQFGPRDPGSKGHRACLDYLHNELNKWADQVSTQKFTFSFGQPVKSVVGTNIIANFQPEKSNRILLAAHWDTRPWADEDANPANHNTPILGANDGASGVAVLSRDRAHFEFVQAQSWRGHCFIRCRGQRH